MYWGVIKNGSLLSVDITVMDGGINSSQKQF